MGMFDEIRCAYPLPDSEVQGHTFQTKSLENLMNQYVINTDGQLIEELYEYQDVMESEWLASDGSDWGNMERDFSKFKWVNIGRKNTEYHGDIYMYTSIGNINDGTSRRYQYQVRFTHGKVEWIRRTEAQ